ncbi:E3 SUMO-protein ligase RanBP2 [Histomonas meleagridis]|uniref:E3 SUMO-protein ligase RanBP2 n=1 Tax=Histomonas meleagridis TaxID=135588 RepID=UPI00355ABD3A|nr:E3 SUMO-protein ligase RanBP2 [Histomonas meleagridis]KAH0803029.1 E3 SUMO-protein ligase RanBP2 [Histomonas meleagridis]
MSDKDPATPDTAAKTKATPNVTLNLTVTVAATPAATSAQDDANAVDDSHKEAPSTAVEQEDPDAGEDKLFGDKAILYRFDATSKEWKERGVGFIKILKSKETGRCRILMRRNQTFRVCANHYILPQMELKPHAGSERALIWTATDFADGTESHDVLSVRFKTAEITQEFKKQFEEAQKINKEQIDKMEKAEEKKE